MMKNPTLYTYDLPPELVAQHPAPRRGDARLMVLRRQGSVIAIRRCRDLPALLRPGDLLLANDSRVFCARLYTRRPGSGGRVELLLLAPVSVADGLPAGAAATDARGAWLALARPARRLRDGVDLEVTALDAPATAGPRLRIIGAASDGEVRVAAADGEDLLAIAERWGGVPLPPYIRRDLGAQDAAERRAGDRRRYQTVYARRDPTGAGSTAAPTAGLHFDRPLLAALAAAGVELAFITLHVGPGTFRPPTAAQIAAGRLHPEFFTMPAATGAAVAACRRRGGRVIAVGTTSLRVLATVAGLQLETGAAVGAQRAWDAAGDPEPVFTGSALKEAAGWTVRGVTRLFIQPPAEVAAADGLLTNFHLPESSLLRLVAAFAGEATWRAAYREAVAQRLRFFSYGDAMLILPAEEGPA